MSQERLLDVKNTRYLYISLRDNHALPKKRASKRRTVVHGAGNKSYDNERASIAISGSRAQSILPSCPLQKDGFLVPLTRTPSRFMVVRTAACRINVGEYIPMPRIGICSPFNVSARDVKPCYRVFTRRIRTTTNGTAQNEKEREKRTKEKT